MPWLALYNLLAHIALPFALAYHWYRSISRGRKAAFGERLGLLLPATRQLLQGAPLVWLHAVSVGEVIAARPLIKGLRRRYPNHKILLSVTTETGRSVAEKDSLADQTMYFPFDVLPVVKRMLDETQPQAIIIMETEIWPIFILEARRRAIPVFLANGRISARSFPRYQKFAWFFKPTLERFTALGMQSSLDYERIVAIGAPPERCSVPGNLKYDILASPVTPDERHELRQRYRIPESLFIMTAGSTHAGEEQQILSSYVSLLKNHPTLFLILVPRHPERTTEVEELIQAAGLQWQRLSTLATVQADLSAGTVLLVDTIGELMRLYAVADIAFVGGSLVPHGGHNLLEPASRGIPMLFGPHMANFREITDLVVEYGAGVQVRSSEELVEALDDLLTSDALCQVLGRNGLNLMQETGGATERYLDLIASHLKP